MKGRRFLLSLCLVALVTAVCLLVLPAQVNAETEGDFTYSVTGGKATITGYTGTGGDVVIPDTLGGYPVTGIGDLAFYKCTSLTFVTIGNGVTSIGDMAFDNCISLTSVTIGNGVTRIGDLVFRHCDSLTSVTIGNGVINIGDGAFAYCTSLTSITIPDSVTSVGNNAFEGCSGLSSITIPDSVTSIGELAFYGCTSLTSVTIPDGVTSIGDYAFQYCKGLTAITIPDSVTSIGDYAFEHCKGLTSVTLGNSVTSIGDNAFKSCTGLTSITIPDSVTSIGDYAFQYCTSLSSVTIGNGVTSIGHSAFRDCTSLTSVTIGNGVTSIDYGAFYNCTGLTSITIPDSVTSIGSNAFAFCVDLTSVTIGNGVTSIGDYAFQYCTSLTSVTIGNGVTSIGSSAFYNCSSLTSIAIPDSVTSIGDYAFQYCSGLTSITIPDRVISIGSSAFIGCTGLDDVYITDPSAWCKITFANSDANPLSYGDKFHILDKNGNEVTDVVLDDSVTAIPVYAFRNCTSLTSVTIPDGVTSIGDYAFQYCKGLTAITIPDSVTSIGDYAFEHCKGLTSVTLGNSVTSIGDNAFKSCTGLTSITIPDSVTSIGNYAFYECTNLTSVTIPDSVTSIGDGAFYNCTSLTSVTIGNGVTSFGDGLFGSWEEPEAVFYKGSQEQWNQIIAGTDNAWLDRTFVHYEVEEVTYAGQDCYYCNHCENYFLKGSISFDYTVSFRDYDGRVISSQNYKLGDKVTVPSAPSRETDLVGSYDFTGWDKEVTTCQGNAVYTATYTTNYIEYTVIFKNYDGSVLRTAQYHYGDTVTEPVAVKAPDVVFFYRFTGWDKPVTACQGNAEYTAVFEAAYIEYTVSFYDWDGRLIDSATYHYGEKVVLPDSPSRAADNTYTYTFKNWGKAVGSCTANAEYTAVYTAVYIDYTVKFLDEDGTVITEKTYHWGDKVEVPTDPVKAADNTYTYTFSGWDKEIVDCAGDATYRATYKSEYIDYTVKFLDEDGEVITEKTYHWGDEIEVPVDPVKAADDTYNYTFSGWDKEIVDCAGDATYRATYKSEYIDYTVKFLDEDGTVIFEKTYHWGDEIEVPVDPVKAADNTYTYAFSGWDKAVVNCAGNTTYTATYKSEYIDYTVKFLDEGGAVITEKTYHWGDEIGVPADPVKAADNTYTYTFSGWDKAVVNCAGDATYTATYKAVYIDYTVKFLDEGGAVITEKTYHWGDEIEAPADPVKEADNTYTYAFSGWDKEVLSNCAGDAIYTANYTAQYIEYTVFFKNWDGRILSSGVYHYGDVLRTPESVARPADECFTYRFVGWSDDMTGLCTGNAVYTAIYDPVYIDYTVKFLNDDGTVIFEKTYHWGDEIKVPVDPVKAADNTYTYAFSGWDKAVVNCAGNTTYTATYKSEYIDYTVKFLDEDGTVITEKTYHWGDKVEVPTDPVKAADDTYNYTFSGWDKEIVDCAGDATYIAQYLSIKKLNGWMEENGKWYYYISDVKQTGWLQDQGAWYYLRADGAMATGWVQDGGKWYFMESSGVMVASQWRKDSKGWCWLTASGAMATNAWVKDSKGWCYIGADGYCLTNCWAKDSVGWIWLDSEGSMTKNQWIADGGKWYYVNSNGYMATGWLQISGTWYYFKSSGEMATGWLQIGGTWYYFKSSGAMTTGWLQQGSVWYYFHSSGAMATGSVKIGNKTYNFSNSGICLNP